MNRAAAGGNAAPTATEAWDANFAAWQAAKADYDAAAAQHDADYEQAQATGRRYDEALAARVDAFATVECDTRMALILTPAPGLPAVSVKMDLLFGPSQFSDFGAEDDCISAWHRRYTDTVLADMARLQSEFAAAWLAAWTKDGGSVVIDDEGKAQIGWPVYDLSPNYRETEPTLPQEVRDVSFIYCSTAHDVTMKARFDALKRFPGGVDMLKAYMQAKGIRVAVHTPEAGQ